MPTTNRIHPGLIFWAVIYAAIAACAIVSGSPLLTSIDAHYSDGSKVSTTAPSVLTATATAIAATQPVVPPKPESLDGTRLTGIIDLGGKTYTLDKQLVDGGGSFTLRNGTIINNSPIKAGAIKISNGALATIQNITFTNSDDRQFCTELWKGSLNLDDATYNQGTLWDGHGGGGNVNIIRPVCTGIPSQYGISTFEQDQTQPFMLPVLNLTVDCTPLPGKTTPVWNQGPNQALLRQMNAVEAHYVGLNIRKNPHMVGPAEVFQPRSCQKITTIDKSMIDGDVQCGRMAWEVPPFPWVMAKLVITNTAITGDFRVKHGTTEVDLSNTKMGALERDPGCKFVIGANVYVGGKLIAK